MAMVYVRKRVDQYVVRPYHYFKFVAQSPKQWRQRVEVVKRFRLVHKSVTCAHSYRELLFIADQILQTSSDLDGDIIECGVYKGGATCKLSIVAKLVGRNLVACDSFSGLPVPEEYDAKQNCCDGRIEFYKQGEWAGSIEEVRANIEHFGEMSSTLLVPGWFHETLPPLQGKRFVCAFIDVDLSESAACCLENLWASLQPGCKLFIHEARHGPVVKLFHDRDFWNNHFGQEPPPLIGERKGLSRFMSCLAYIEKPSTVRNQR